MKKLNLLVSAVLLTLISTLGYAQAPESFNYQAVLRDAAGSIIANQNVTMRFAVRTGNANGIIQYNEEQVLSTNEFGLVDHAVGTGTVLTGNFDNISWDASPKFLRVQLDNGGGMVTIGTQQLLSVPYALNAKTAESIVGGIPSSGWNTAGNNISNSNSGNVGVGTTNPIQKLDVNGRLNVASGVIQSGGSAITTTADLGLYSRTSGNWLRFSTNNAQMRFFTNDANGISSGGGSPTMTIATNGNVGIGTTDPTERLHVNGGLFANGLVTLSGGYVRLCQTSNNSSGNVAMGGQSGYSNVKCNINSNQDWALQVEGVAGKTGGGSWSGASDRRLKDRVVPYKDGLESVLNIKPVTYHYNKLSGFDTETEYVGIIAQELQEVAPYMVTSAPFKDTGNEYLVVDNSAMTYMLINAVKEQQEQIDALKAEIEALKNK